MTKAQQKAYIDKALKKKLVVYYRSDQDSSDLRSISLGGWEGLMRHPNKDIFVLVAHPNEQPKKKTRSRSTIKASEPAQEPEPEQKKKDVKSADAEEDKE